MTRKRIRNFFQTESETSIFRYLGIRSDITNDSIDIIARLDPISCDVHTMQQMWWVHNRNNHNGNTFTCDEMMSARLSFI